VTRYTLSPRAQADIEDIWNYTIERWDAQQAEIYLRQLRTAIESVAATPRLGRSCSHIREGYYKYASGSHILFYRLVANSVDVVRILHERMDFERHL
jgi:toxin ParE1/3/4